MQKAEPQHEQTQHRSARRQVGGVQAESPQGGQIAQLEAMMESSPQVEHQGGLAAMMNASPAMVAQGKRIDMIHNSPRQSAQQKSFDGIHNSPTQVAQRKKFDSSSGAVQRVEDEEPLQRVVADTPVQRQAEAKPNNTGLPDNLKSGIESLSGMSLDNVKVHYNSSQPAQLNALAYAQGSDIHVAPGQEQHLPHEAWHVVQQAQGRVKPTMQMKDGVPVNDDKGLEQEADVMGERAVQMKEGQAASLGSIALPRHLQNSGAVVQRTEMNFAVEKREHPTLATFYSLVVAPWLEDVSERHPEASGAVEDAKEDVENGQIDVYTDWESIETLVLMVNAAIGKENPHFRGENEEVVPTVGFDPADEMSKIYDYYGQTGGIALQGQVATVCGSQEKAGGHYKYKGDSLEMWHSSHGPNPDTGGNAAESRTAWVIENPESGKVEVVGIGIHKTSATYTAIFPKAKSPHNSVGVVNAQVEVTHDSGE